MSEDWYRDAKAEVARMTPEEGYNVVEVDDYFGPPPELNLVSHHMDREEAEEARARNEEETGLKTFVYGPVTPR